MRLGKKKEKEQREHPAASGQGKGSKTENVLLTGQLLKSETENGEYVANVCVLTTTTLSLKKGKEKEQQVFFLTAEASLFLPFPQTGEETSPFKFQLVGLTEKWFLGCVSASERKCWMDALAAALQIAVCQSLLRQQLEESSENPRNCHICRFPISAHTASSSHTQNDTQKTETHTKTPKRCVLCEKYVCAFCSCDVDTQNTHTQNTHTQNTHTQNTHTQKQERVCVACVPIYAAKKKNETAVLAAATTSWKSLCAERAETVNILAQLQAQQALGEAWSSILQWLLYTALISGKEQQLTHSLSDAILNIPVEVEAVDYVELLSVSVPSSPSHLPSLSLSSFDPVSVVSEWALDWTTTELNISFRLHGKKILKFEVGIDLAGVSVQGKLKFRFSPDVALTFWTMPALSLNLSSSLRVGVVPIDIQSKLHSVIIKQFQEIVRQQALFPNWIVLSESKKPLKESEPRTTTE
eukprot:TRINITY_DN796_c1_g1_i1.p1 TRINITY_DN796_c1_g1~~TRINITY_DN796_c1_g1_i1.p1  ORF type:complete len:468 (-),score=165.09 TRINITY_DN796_c1_g1_i1:87-1490(-)